MAQGFLKINCMMSIRGFAGEIYLLDNLSDPAFVSSLGGETMLYMPGVTPPSRDGWFTCGKDVKRRVLEMRVARIRNYQPKTNI
jgi:hypothetical protein